MTETVLLERRDAIEGEQFARMAATQDVHEGLGAWIARRTPDYQGR